jgi:hypothetical protein
MRAAIKKFLNGKTDYAFGFRRWLDLDAIQRAVLFASMVIPEYMDVGLINAPTGNIQVIAPHPDDEIVGCGGTLILSSRAGASIQIKHFFTENNTNDTVNLCKAFSEEHGMKIVDRFAGKPDHVFVPYFMDGHRDHRAANSALRTIVGNPLVWAYQVYSVLPPNVCIDITSVSQNLFQAERKITPESKDEKWRHWHDGILIYNTRWLPRNKLTGEKYVEAFLRIPLEEYWKWVQGAKT